MSDVTHTRIPWKVAGYPEGPSVRPIIIQSEEVAELCGGEPDPRYIASVGCDSPAHGWDAEDWSNAHLLVRAVNAHDALVEACKTLHGAAKELLALAQQHDPETGRYRKVDPYEVLRILDPKTCRLDVVNALAKLEDKP